MSRATPSSSSSSSVAAAAAAAPSSRDGDPPGYDIGQNFTSALAIGLAAMLCTFALLAFYFCRYISLGNRQQELQQGQDECECDHQSSSLDEFPVFGSLEELRQGENSKSRVVIKGGESCAVCLGDLSTKPYSTIEGENRVRFLPQCGHCFHCDCVDEWLRRHMLCPICRRSLKSWIKTGSGIANSVAAPAPASSSQVEASGMVVAREDGGAGGDGVQVLIASNRDSQHEATDHSK